MALGAHELLLLVRAQNQASAALGRVRRDLMALERQRDLQLRRAQLQRRAAAQGLRLAQMRPGGSRAISMDQRALRIQNEIANVAQRNRDLDIRRIAIQRGYINTDNTRIRLENRISNMQNARIALATKELTIQQKIAQT